MRKEVGAAFPIVAGNVCTVEGTKAFCDAGADIVRVNVGPGAMCRRRRAAPPGRRPVALASRVMIGTGLAGTYESPGDIKEDKGGRLYKENYGIASYQPVMNRNANLNLFEQAKKAFFREGISTSRIYLNPGMESVRAVLVDIITGLQSAYTYVGTVDSEAFAQSAVVVVHTNGWLR